MTAIQRLDWGLGLQCWKLLVWTSLANGVLKTLWLDSVQGSLTKFKFSLVGNLAIKYDLGSPCLCFYLDSVDVPEGTHP